MEAVEDAATLETDAGMDEDKITLLQAAHPGKVST